MKKILIIFSLLFLFCLSGCNTEVNEIIAIKHENTILSDKNDEVLFSISLKNYKLINEMNEVKEFIIYYSYEVETKEELLKAEKLTNQSLKIDELNTYAINLTEELYNKTLNVLFCLKLSKDGDIYSNVIKANITVMAREELAKNPVHETAKKIIDYLESIGSGNITDPSKKAISEISITVDISVQTKLLTFETEQYTYTYSNPNYDKITVMVYIKDEYAVTTDFALIFNGEVVPNSKYKIENNAITYIFLDPNWTGIY